VHKGYEDLLEDYQVMMMQMGGVPHWGKMNKKLYLNPGFIDQHYPKVQTFRDVRKKMDPKGTFVNDFIVKMGL
jgi:L-gulonolactone oxidase